jgi:hypothetical protein
MDFRAAHARHHMGIDFVGYDAFEHYPGHKERQRRLDCRLERLERKHNMHSRTHGRA